MSSPRPSSRDDRPDRFPASVYREDAEPDPRFSLANERTFLARIRTSVALLAAGIWLGTRRASHAAQRAAGLSGAVGPLSAGTLAAGVLVLLGLVLR